MRIGIFRKRLLPLSETFIAAQGNALPDGVTARYIGLTMDKGGLYHLNNDQICCLSPSQLDYGLAKFEVALRQKLNSDSTIPRRWSKNLNHENLDVVHSHFGKTGLAGRKIADALDLPHIVTFHGHDIAPTRLAPDYLQALPSLWSSSTKIVAISKHIERCLLARGAPENKIIQHYIGVDTEKFSTSDRQESGIPTILFVGRAVDKKGIPSLLQAFKIVSSKYPEAELRFIGEGKLLEESKQFARENKLNIVFLGAQPPERIQEELRSAWMFCGPSAPSATGDEEGLGIVFLEAQASGVPVVSTFCGGIPEAVENGTTGLLTPPNNALQLSDSLLQLLDNSALRHTMGAAARERAVREFSITEQSRKLAAIYNEVR